MIEKVAEISEATDKRQKRNAHINGGIAGGLTGALAARHYYNRNFLASYPGSTITKASPAHAIAGTLANAGMGYGLGYLSKRHSDKRKNKLVDKEISRRRKDDQN